MTDDEMYQLLTDFGNGHTLAKDIEVSVLQGCTSFTPRFPAEFFKHEDSELLSEMIRGAQHFLWWLRRTGKTGIVKASRKGMKRAKTGVKASKKRLLLPKGYKK